MACFELECYEKSYMEIWKHKYSKEHVEVLADKDAIMEVNKLLSKQGMS